MWSQFWWRSATRIEVDQGLIEVETEKASVEVPSTAAGTVTEIHVKVGDVLGENAPIVTLDAIESRKREPSPYPLPTFPRSPDAKPETVQTMAKP